MKKLFITLSLLLLSSTVFALSYTKEVSEKELQKSISAFMPLTQKNNFVSVTVKEPVIDLRKGSDKIALSSAIDATIMGGKTASGTIDVAGNIEYNKDDGAFYLQNIEVLNFKSDKISDAYKDIVKVLAQQVLNTALKTHPIYKLDTSKTQDKLVKATLKSVKIKDEKLLLKMGLF